jgi:Porin subfamily
MTRHGTSPSRAGGWLLRAAAVAMVLVGGIAVGFAAEDDDEDEDTEETIPATPCARLAYEDEETPLPRAIRLDRDGTCIVVGGEARLGHQWQNRKGSTGLIGFAVGGGGLVQSNRAFTFSSALKLEAHRFTDFGRFGIITELGWQTTQGDGLDRGLLQLRKGFVRLGGLRAGFGDSFANYFDAPLLSTAFAPKRSVGFIGFEAELGESTRLAVAVETGPAFGSAQLRVVPVKFDTPPFFVARFQHDFTGGDLHAAAVYTGGESKPTLSGTTKPLPGYALTAGLRLDLSRLAPKDEVSLQVTYARNAPSYLGVAIDLGNLGSRLAEFAESTAVSGIAAFTHNWSETWTSAVFASGARLETGGVTNITSRSLRYGANLSYTPQPGLKIGVEASRQHSELTRVPLAGILPPQRSRAIGTSVVMGVQASF